MKGNDFNIALTIFYLAVSGFVFWRIELSNALLQYFASDIPSNLIMKRVGSAWIAVLTFSFGIVSFGSAFVHNYHQLIVTRIFLGLAEGGSLVSFISWILLPKLIVAFSPPLSTCWPV